MSKGPKSSAKTKLVELPKFSLVGAHRHLPAQEWEQISGIITSQLAEINSLPTTHKIEPNVTDFLASFLRDIAREKLRGKPALASTPGLRNNILQLTDHLSTQDPRSIGVEMLLDLSVVFSAQEDRPTIQNIFRRALETNDSKPSQQPLQVILKSEVVPSFSAALTVQLSPQKNVVAEFISSRLSLVRLIRALLEVDLPEVTSIFARNKAFILALSKCYNQTLGAVAESEGGVVVDRDAARGWEKGWMLIKVNILDVLHVILDGALKEGFGPTSPSQEEQEIQASRENLFDVLLALLEDSNNYAVKTSNSQWFIDQPLLADYEHAHGFSRDLKELVGDRDPMVDFILPSLQGLTSGVTKGRAEGGLKILLEDQPSSAVITSNKGKGKEVDLSDDKEPSMDAAVAQVLDIFPDEDRDFVESALRHPSISGSADALVAMLLEGSLPPDIAALKDIETPYPIAEEPSVERRNIFDDEELDFSKLRIGKNRAEDADTVLQDKTFIASLKADILRRAAEDSDEDEEYDIPGQERQRRIPFTDHDELLDDMDDVGTRVKIGAAEGEDTDDDESAVQESIESTLEKLYIQNPKLFDRDQATRRSSARADLKAQTGWADEQLEGWRIMLERNPRKDKILAKHEFSGNKPLNAPRSKEYDSEEQGSGRDGPPSGRGQHRGGQRGGERGGRGGRGRGRGSPSDTNQTSRDRALKERNKNKARQRGHDTKMSRGGM